MAQFINMKQVPSGTVTAKDDRIVYDANLADCGIIYGCQISYIGNNMIHINAGYGIIKGGLFEIEDHTEYVEYAVEGRVTGQIYLHLDLSADDKLTIVKETTNSLHPMEQNANANFESGVYEFQLCTFTATPTTLEDVTQTFSIVQSGVIDSLQEIAANTIGGLKAGALAVKELNSNLTAKLPNDIEGFSVSDGNAYITYKVGADSVTKKLGDFSSIIFNNGFGVRFNGYTYWSNSFANINQTNMQIQGQDEIPSARSIACVSTNFPIDLTNVNSIEIELSGVTWYNDARCPKLYLTDNKVSGLSNNDDGGIGTPIYRFKNNGTFTIDVSAISGNKYLSMLVVGVGSRGIVCATINRIELN